MGSFQGLGREVYPSLGESSSRDPDSLSPGFEKRIEGAPGIPDWMLIKPSHRRAWVGFCTRCRCSLPTQKMLDGGYLFAF